MDNLISTKIPDATIDRELFEIVIAMITDGLCGNIYCYIAIHKKCTYNYKC